MNLYVQSIRKKNHYSNYCNILIKNCTNYRLIISQVCQRTNKYSSFLILNTFLAWGCILYLMIKMSKNNDYNEKSKYGANIETYFETTI